MEDKYKTFKMRGTEIRALTPVSVFVIFFSAVFIITLIYFLCVNLKITPKISLEIFKTMTDKFDLMKPIPRSVCYALLFSLGGGIGATLLALIYNIFSNIFGGVRAELKD